MCPYNSILRFCFLSDKVEINGRRVGCQNAMRGTHFLEFAKNLLLQWNILNNRLQ
ncbi:hypothetical protein HanPSC8_Chr10g0448411 [Helianthus annuus]|nr:hypothetical protein HanPSC8_Chr10g0448411 [Helianthus annuus]